MVAAPAAGDTCSSEKCWYSSQEIRSVIVLPLFYLSVTFAAAKN